MGQYLSIAVAETIFVKKERTKEEILDLLKSKLNLEIYNILEGESYIALKLKEDFFEKNIIGLMKEISTYCNDYDNKSLTDKIKDLERKKYDELIEIAEKHKMNFSYMTGDNDISYLCEKLDISCNAISILDEGKIFMECYNDMFSFLRNIIVKSLKNPIASSVVVTIIG